MGCLWIFMQSGKYHCQYYKRIAYGVKKVTWAFDVDNEDCNIDIWILRKVFWKKNKKSNILYFQFDVILITNFLKFIAHYYSTKFVCICFFAPNLKRSNSHPTQASF